MKKITEKLKKIIRIKGLNQADLAKISGASTASVSAWFQGSKPRSRYLESISKYFDIDYDSLENENKELVFTNLEASKASNANSQKSNEYEKNIANNSHSPEDLIRQVEDLYNINYDEDVILLLKAINQMPDSSYDFAIDFLKKYNAMHLATIISMFKVMHKNSSSITEINSGKTFSSGREHIKPSDQE